MARSVETATGTCRCGDGRTAARAAGPRRSCILGRSVTPWKARRGGPSTSGEAARVVRGASRRAALCTSAAASRATKARCGAGSPASRARTIRSARRSRSGGRSTISPTDWPRMSQERRRRGPTWSRASRCILADADVAASITATPSPSVSPAPSIAPSIPPSSSAGSIRRPRPSWWGASAWRTCAGLFARHPDWVPFEASGSSTTCSRPGAHSRPLPMHSSKPACSKSARSRSPPHSRRHGYRGHRRATLRIMPPLWRADMRNPPETGHGST